MKTKQKCHVLATNTSSIPNTNTGRTGTANTQNGRKFAIAVGFLFLGLHAIHDSNSVSRLLRVTTSYESVITSTIQDEQDARVKEEHHRHWIAFTVFASGPLRDEQMLSLIFARYMNPLSPIVLILLEEQPDAIVVDHRHWTLLHLLNVQLSTAQQSASQQQLQKDYKHSSVNSYEFERQCVQRFLALGEFAQSQQPNLLTIAHLDMDLAVQSPHQPFPIVPGTGPTTSTAATTTSTGEDIWALIPTSTYFIRFTNAGLADFGRFIKEFYALPTDSTFRAMQTFGDSASSLSQQERLATAIKGWYDTSNSTIPVVPEYKQFSDMHLLKMYLTSQTSLNVHILERGEWSNTTKFLVGIRQAFANPMKDERSCRPGGDVFRDLTWNQHRAYYRDSPLPGLHFQGTTCKKHMCAVLCPHILWEHARLLPCCHSFSEQNLSSS
jgi:hypothetical protein